jgi:signal transduction histidine kinase/CheY-like chemotaxis protein
MGQIFDTASLAPHGFCLLWRPELIWLHVVSDLLIGLAYYSIPLALATLVWRRRGDLDFGWIFWMFAGFILACGTTHFMEIWTLWHPDYAAQGLLKAFTATLSVATAILLWRLLPAALALPSPAMLRRVNEELSVQIGERNQAVEALQREFITNRQAEKMLREAQKMEGLSQLTGGVAHDFNNLLLILQSNLHIVKQRYPASLAETQIAAMERAIARGESLARQLLTFARRQTLQPRSVDLQSELPKLVGLVRSSLPSTIAIETELEPDTWPVEIDPNEFELAMINLANNARDAMPRGGVLRILVDNQHLGDGDGDTLAGDFLRIRVSDTGEGIPQGIIGRVFDPFFTTKPAGKGSGLGLSQVYGFARQSGGLATIESEPGAGTLVTLHLPRAKEQVSPRRIESPSGGIDRRADTVLLVEDNAEVSEVSVFLLQDFGYAVKVAENAQQALDMLADGVKVDLVFSDIVMPGGMSGVDLARTLRQRWPDLPVLLTTGFSAATREAAEEGIPIIAKPYRPEALRRAIGKLLGLEGASP